MKQFDFDISYIVPFTHKMTPIEVTYDHKKIYDHIVMPWETGISKKICFCLRKDIPDFNIDKLRIINSLNKMSISIESVLLNGTIQNITPCIADNQKQIYLDIFFKACSFDATVFKIAHLPDYVSLSHSYVCNGFLYVPKCDRYNSILSFNKENTDFRFSIECFHTHISECLYHIECHFNDFNIRTKVIPSSPHNIAQLHNYLKENYAESQETELHHIDKTQNEDDDYKKTA